MFTITRKAYDGSCAVNLQVQFCEWNVASAMPRFGHRLCKIKNVVIAASLFALTNATAEVVCNDCLPTSNVQQRRSACIPHSDVNARINSQIDDSDELERMEFDLRRKYAEKGSPLEQTAVGCEYLKGTNGAPKDAKAAVVWFKKAADREYPIAMFLLAKVYLTGVEGVCQDVPLGMKYLHRSRDKGCEPAKEYFDDMLKKRTEYILSHIDSAKPVAERIAFLRQYANKGHGWANYLLSQYYFSGEGVARDMCECKRLLKQASDQGIDKAQKALELIEKGENLEQSARFWERKAQSAIDDDDDFTWDLMMFSFQM